MAAFHRRLRLWFGFVILTVVSGCGVQNSVFNPSGTGASAIADLGVLLLVIAGGVYLFVVGLLLFGLLRRRGGTPRERANPAITTPVTLTDAEPRGARAFVIAAGVVMPTLVLSGVFAATLYTLNKLTPEQPETLTIYVIGHQFWWEVRYPDSGVVTANEIHIPVGVPVTIKLQSADVIHSFWVPELNGKADLIPGRTNTIVLNATKAGQYRGQCAEFCGMQHAHMAFLVVADPPEVFAAWLSDQAQPAPYPADEVTLRGRQLFLGSSCVYCHAIRGTNAQSGLGPDLTHLASRRYIGAGTLVNNRGNLAGWIVNAHASKPGNRMPPMYLEPDELQDLLVYLQSLE